jgi:predicted ATP pyrophosphatase (TIGR00289 family)
MRVAILFSGGKDSTFALYEALKKNWEVVALIAVKPKNTEAYLWHYATVEWTLLSSQALGIPLFLVKCDKIGAEEEAKELEKVFERIKIDALVLGGVGLQKTQIREVKKVAKKYGIKVVIPHKGKDHYELFKEAIKSGFEIMITQVASQGLGPEWLGRKVDLETLEELKKLSEKHGFHIGFEGGYADSFVVNGPIFKKKIEFVDTEKVWDNETYSGYLEVKEAKLVEK